MNKWPQSKERKFVNSSLPRRLIWHGLQFVIVVILISGCTYDTNEGNMLSDARDANDAENILSGIFTLEVTTATEVASYLGDRGLNCTEKESADYDPEFADSFYDSSIVCWLPAPNADARSKLDGLDSLLVTYVFRTVFLFEGEVLSGIRVVLDDRGL